MKMRRLLILAGVVLISISTSGCGYNTLTTKQQNVKAKWANVETQLQRRADLINNLVETAKLAGVQKQAVIDAANSFGGTIGRLLVLQEAYPQLRSNENFLKLQDEVVGTENRIAVARRDYNEGVQDYNTTAKSFPTV